MERLTRKDRRTKLGVNIPAYPTDFEKRIYLKLFNLENLEEELGIDLLTLFKALKEGIYSRDYGYLLVEHFVLKHEKQLHCKPTIRKELRFALKDYKKTWALCRGDLEDEKMV